MSNTNFSDPVRGGWAIRRGLFGASLLLLVTRCGGGSQPPEAHESIGKTSAPLVSSEWTAAVSMSVARQNHVAALLHNGSVLVAGGHPGNNVSTTAAEVYNPATGTWTTVGSMGTARRLFGACTLASGKVLVAGGNATAGDVTSAELFDPSANTWSATGSLAAAREDFSMTCLSDGRVLVAGGSGPSGLLSSAEIYSPTTGAWSSAGTLPAAIHTQGAVLLNDGRVLIAGGNNAAGPIKTAAIWSPSTNAWTATASMATARSFYALQILGDGRVLAAGGLAALPTTTTKAAEIYTPSTGAWSAAANLNTARYSGVSATLTAGPIVIGGVGTSGPPLATSESYDSVHNTWTQLVTTYGAVNQTATALTPSTLLVAGGNTGSSATASAQIYGILNGFALYAQRSVTLGTSDHINGGDVGVTSAAPSSFGPQLVVGASTTVQTTHNLAAPSVSLGSGAHVGDVQTNSLTNSGGTLGTQAPYPSSLPPTPIALPTGPGGSAVTVPAFTITTLNPGNYGALSVTGTVYLNAGNYTFSSVTMAAQGHLAGVSGTATVSVAGTFQAGNSVSISSPGATPAGQLVISVAGSDSGSTPAFSIGTGAAMSAILSAPHGTLSIGASTTASGAFAGFDVKLGNGVTINYQNGFVGGAAQTGQQQLSGYITDAMAAAPLIGPAPQSAPLVLAISLPVQVPTSFPALADFAQQVSDPNNARYRQFLTPAQYAGYYQPSMASYNALQTFVQSYGLTVARTTPDNEIIDVTGTAGQVEQMISANLNVYARPDGSQFFAPDREPSLALSTPVLSVAGIKNYAVPISAGPGTGPTGGDLIGKDFWNAYLPGCQGQFDGTGQTIGIIESAQTFNPTDIAAYATAAKIPAASITTVTYSAPYSATLATNLAEAPLDIEVAHAMAPGAKIVVYIIPSASISYGFGGISFIDDVLHDMAHPPAGVARPSQNSSSYTGFDINDDMVQGLASLASLGESFFTSSGDGGAFTGDSLDLRTLGNVTVVGGTVVASFGAGMSLVEQGWTGSGGGFFGPVFTTKSGAPGPNVLLPGYQSGFVTNGASSVYRNFPDVAMASGYTNIADFYTLPGGTTATDNPTGGTSASTPLWAGFMALANQAAQSNGVQTVGFANPLLYAMAGKAGLYASCFNDIAGTVTNPPNTAQPGFGPQDPASPAPSGGFSVGLGYDLVTGLGSPTCGLIAQLASITPLVPVPPPPPPAQTLATEVFAGIGPEDSCGLLSGVVQCWGANGSGQDGNGGGSAQSTPGCVKGLPSADGTPVQVVEGNSHSCALFSDGTVWCWGDNTYGQLGQPGGASPGSSPSPLYVSTLTVASPNVATQISAGGQTTCALLTDGSVWCWGSNLNGQLGTGSSTSGPTPPTQVVPLSKASQVEVSPGGFFACAVLVGGSVECWGTGYLGDGKFDTNSVPTFALGLPNATSIAPGVSHTCAVVTQSTGTNALYCWGNNQESEIGEGDFTTGALPTAELSPVVASMLSGVNVIAAAAGSNYTCVLVAGGTVECWGDNTYGELGDGMISFTPNFTPTAISGLTGVTQLAGGTSQVCALSSSGTGSAIKCWGTGAVGDGTNGETGNPVLAGFGRCM